MKCSIMRGIEDKRLFMVFGIVLAVLFSLGGAFGAEPPGASARSLIGPTGHFGYLYASLCGDNTVIYTVDHVDPNSDFTILIIDVKTGSEETEEEHSNENGHFEGSHTMKKAFAPGTDVFVGLIQDDKVIDFVHLTVPMKAPWWAYTGIGTAIYFLF